MMLKVSADERKRDIIAASSGNHAQDVHVAKKALGISRRNTGCWLSGCLPRSEVVEEAAR